VECRLGDALTLVNGRAYKKPEMLSEGTPILRIQNLNGGENWFYSDLDLPVDKYCEKGDLLYAWSATFGPYWSRWDHRLIYHYHIWKVVPGDCMDKIFAFYELKRITGALKASAHGVAMPHITKSGMEDWAITLPPLAEQKAIAEKLDTLLAQVESTKARLERIPKILKRFRQSVLAAAVSGKLTEVKENDFSEITIEGLAKERKYSLGIGPFGSNLKVSDYCAEGHPLVFVREIRAGRFGDGATKYVSSGKFDELRAHRVLPGDVLITKMGDPPGDVAIYPVNRPEAVITADCIKLSVNQNVAMTKYVSYAMQSEQFRLSVISISAGVAQQKVNLTKFRKLTLPTPSLEKQTEIVRRVDQLFAYADTIETQVNNALERVNNLTQSILAKAFRGELTEQWRKDNPDLINGENSAEALLEKIKAEREVAKSKKKAKEKVRKG